MSKITGNEPANAANELLGYSEGTPGFTYHQGITIRQHYAGLAMRALIAPGDINYNMKYMDQMTQLAIDFSDSLIDNLNKKPS